MTCQIINGDCIEVMRGLAPESVHCCVTSPPYYGLRDYGVEGQIGLEETPEAYVARLVDVFREVRRVLRDDGTLWLNLGDSYAGSGKGPSGNFSKGNAADKARNMYGSEAGRKVSSLIPEGLKAKDLIGIPWRVAFALQADGWYLRQDIIWHKPNPMPESVTDRCTKAHEYIFLLTKSARYFMDMEAVREPIKDNSGQNMRAPKLGDHRADGNYDTVTTKTYSEIKGANRRSVWTITTKPYSGAHFATFPPDLIEPCILAGCPVGGTVLDPFGGSGTTGAVAIKHRRNALLIELNVEYLPLINERIRQAEVDAPLLLDYMEASI